MTTLRDFFITLFFVALGMTIPVPGLSVIGLALMIAAFTVVSRVVTTFTPLYLMKQGLRAEPVAGDQPGADLRILAGRDPDRHCRTPYQHRDVERRVVRLRGAGGREHVRYGAERPGHAGADRSLETDRPARSRSQA